MNAKNINSEKGQVIVYLVLGLVVFLGFVALAIDGGMALADRRHLQNAADAASLAGGGKVAFNLENAIPPVTTANWNCGSLNWAKNNAEVAAFDRAKTNGFDIIYNLDSDLPGSDTNYALATCKNKYIDVTVDIFKTTPSNFLQLIFPNALQNKVEAVTRVYPREPLAYGNAIVALNKDITPCNMETGAGFSGNALLNVYGGGIFSNGCLVGKSSGNCADQPIKIFDGQVAYFEDSFKACVFSPEPVPATDPISLEQYDIQPDCTATTHNITVAQLKTNYINPKKSLEKGLWCITGDLSLQSNDSLHGNEVTIVMKDGWFKSVAGSEIILTAPVKNPNPSPAIPGLLLYLPVSNHNIIDLAGNEKSSFTGTILAPSADITINGTSNPDAYHSQVIGFDVKVNGTTRFNITFNPDEQAGLPTKMELYR
jgi:hypothetical protein